MRFFGLTSPNKLRTKINHILCPTKRARIITAPPDCRGIACSGKTSGNAKWSERVNSLFRTTGNRGDGNFRSFQFSLAIAPLHNPTILTQAVSPQLTYAPHQVPNSKEHAGDVALLLGFRKERLSIIRAWAGPA
jgi:hypothetical protein